MSEFGQKIYKWVIWLAIIIFVVVGVIKKIESIANPLVTKAEWLDEMSEISNNPALDTMTGSEEVATGEFVALACMKAIGMTDISLCFGDEVKTDDELIQAAIGHDIIAKKDLKKKVTSIKAEEIYFAFEEYFNDFSNYRTYGSVDYNVDIVSTDNWNVQSFSPEDNVAVVSGLSSAPEEGGYIILKNDYGIGCLRKIVGVKENGSLYELELEEWNEEGSPIKSLEFAGPVDFSYLADGEVAVNEDEEPDESETEETVGSIPSFAPLKSYALEIEKNYIADIEIGGEITVERSDGETDITPKIYSQVTHDNKTASYNVEKAKNGSINIDKVREAKIAELKKKVEENGYLTFPGTVDETIGATIRFKAHIDGLQLFVSLSNKEDEATVKLNAADVGLEASIAGSYSGEILIAEFEAPIVGGWLNIVSVTIGLYLKVEAGGEISLTYGITNVNMSCGFKDGSSWRNVPTRKPSFGLNGKISMEGGAAIKVTLNVFGKFIETVEVEVDCTAKVEAEVLEKKDGYDDYPPCVQLSVCAPLVTIKLDVLGNVNKSLDNEWNIMSEDNALLKMQTHVETDKNYELHPIEGPKEVCTHKEIEPNVFGTGASAAVNAVASIGNNAQENAKKKLAQQKKEAVNGEKNKVTDAVQERIDEKKKELKEKARKKVEEKAQEVTQEVGETIDDMLNDFFGALCNSCGCK